MGSRFSVFVLLYAREFKIYMSNLYTHIRKIIVNAFLLERWLFHKTEKRNSQAQAGHVA